MIQSLDSINLLYVDIELVFKRFVYIQFNFMKILSCTEFIIYKNKIT